MPSVTWALHLHRFDGTSWGPERRRTRAQDTGEDREPRTGCEGVDRKPIRSTPFSVTSSHHDFIFRCIEPRHAFGSQEISHRIYLSLTIDLWILCADHDLCSPPVSAKTRLSSSSHLARAAPRPRGVTKNRAAPKEPGPKGPWEGPGGTKESHPKQSEGPGRTVQSCFCVCSSFFFEQNAARYSFPLPFLGILPTLDVILNMGGVGPGFRRFCLCRFTGEVPTCPSNIRAPNAGRTSTWIPNKTSICMSS